MHDPDAGGEGDKKPPLGVKMIAEHGQRPGHLLLRIQVRHGGQGTHCKLSYPSTNLLGIEVVSFPLRAPRIELVLLPYVSSTWRACVPASQGNRGCCQTSGGVREKLPIPGSIIYLTDSDLAGEDVGRLVVLWWAPKTQGVDPEASRTAGSFCFILRYCGTVVYVRG